MSQYSFDASIEDFEAKVLQPAMETPVVVDFWAPWCEPCKVLKPMLEKLADEYKGRFLLAKINSDDNPEIAQHFGVRSIPSVKVLFQGQLVDEFNGALPESQIREFLDRIALPAGPGGSNPREEAAALVAEGKLEEALAKLVAASQANPQDQAVQLDAVDVLMQLGRNDEAGQLLAGEYAQEADRANALRTRLALAAGAADTTVLEAKLAANPADHASRLELSRAYAAQNRFREAMEAALEVVIRDRAFDEGAGRKALLQLFEALGGSEQYDDLIREFRRKMSAALN
jgi:putative thioredoxin